jgi:hypothetical protein
LESSGGGCEQESVASYLGHDGVSEQRDMAVDAWRSSIDVTLGNPPIKVSDVEAGNPVAWDAIIGTD